MLAILYIILGTILVVDIIYNLYKNFITSRFMISAGLLIYYILPALSNINADAFNYINRYELYYGINISPSYKAFFAITLFYIVFSLGQRVVVKKYYNDRYIPNEKKHIKKLSIIILLFSFSIFMVYTTLFGGFREYLNNIASIRAGYVPASEGKYAFISKLYLVAPFSTYLVVGYWKEKKERLFILITILFSGLMVVSTGGRGGLLVFLIIIVLGFYQNKNSDKIKIKPFIIIILMLLAIVILYRPFLVSLEYLRESGIEKAIEVFLTQILTSGKYNISSIQNIISSLLSSFDHYYVSLETAIVMVDSGIHNSNYFMELYISATSIIPSLLLNISKLHPITYYNSMYISGEAGIAQIPSGIIAAAYYSGNFLWIMIYGFLIGSLGRQLDNFYKRLKNTSKFINGYYFALLFFYFGYGIGGDFASTFQKTLTTILVIILVNKMIRIKMEKNHTQLPLRLVEKIK